jgi:hypothetical protein
MFCNKFMTKVREIFRKFDQYVREHVGTALFITTNIRALLDSPWGVLITDLIPGEADELARKKIVEALDKSIGYLQIVDTCGQLENTQQKLNCFLAELKKLNPAIQEAVLFKLASLLASELDGDRFKRHLYDTWVQGQFAASK